jgi:hypothetical protein
MPDNPASTEEVTARLRAASARVGPARKAGAGASCALRALC